MSSPMRFRTSALFPFVTSIIAFALVLVLVISGTNPGSVPDAYLISFNTTSLGSNLIELNPIDPVASATPTANAARDVRTKLLSMIVRRSIIKDGPDSSSINTNSSITGSTNSNSSISSSSASNSSLSAAPSLNISSSAVSNSSSTSSAAPTLTIPQAAVVNPAAIPISLVGVAFQLILNTLASGMGQTFESLISTVITTQKQSFGVSQFYTIHVSGICQGSVFNANATNLTTPLNLTHCISYADAGSFVSNLTSNVSDSALVAATNVTVPALSKVPSIGKSTKSLIDLASGIVLFVFIVGLIGNGLSILLSVAAFVLPNNGKIHAAGAGITTFSTQLLQAAALTSTTIAVGLSSSINNFSDVLGLSATVGGKFLALIWFGYITAQMANGYWVATWFVKFRTTAYKARQRTPQQMQAGYKGIKKEVLSDLRLEKVDYEDTEVLTSTKGQIEIQHWQDNYRMM
ncbi:uncharacterized protein LY89DRAFT_712907 [Mollisia scopiformis]|uniref:Uncharacterized protein n=1 Tax=Mollisia scopiformis TaxID=149040 RepID=A0A194XUY9_MOLSC|nr:uncharacterized protein LY89DRAFT_712907 [Mollisia scopiformis]KUJ23951.1 hypothetical protein LY89DRAFT_712907 [Mollisia scopiformis]